MIVLVLSAWEQQFQQYGHFLASLFANADCFRHVRPKTISLCRYHGQKRSDVDISAFDIILTSFQIITSEWKPGVGSKSGIFSNSWHRVVLDEGIVANSMFFTRGSLC